jgi:hypothetical protein
VYIDLQKPVYGMTGLEHKLHLMLWAVFIFSTHTHTHTHTLVDNVCVSELHSICHGLLSYHGYVVERDNVLWEVWTEDGKNS